MNDLRCSKCGNKTEADADAETVTCATCVIGEENFLDYTVLTPENSKQMRQERGMDLRQAAKYCDKDTYPQTIQAFERGSRPCPPGLVRMIYEWWIGG